MRNARCARLVGQDPPIGWLLITTSVDTEEPCFSLIAANPEIIFYELPMVLFGRLYKRIDVARIQGVTAVSYYDCDVQSFELEENRALCPHYPLNHLSTISFVYKDGILSGYDQRPIYGIGTHCARPTD